MPTVRPTLLAGLLAAGLAVPALAQSDDEVARFLSAAASAGCLITAETGTLIEERSGLDPETLRKIIERLVVEQGVAAQQTTAGTVVVRVTAGPCAG